MGAAYNSQERDPAPRCLPGTRKEILEQIEKWVKPGSKGKSILWLHGPAGAGKSAIAQTIAEKCAGRDQLAASFFFARTVPNRNSAKHLLQTIAAQIALSVPEKRKMLDTILKKDPCIAERALGSVDLLVSLFQQGSALVPPSRFLVVIDGLDECQGRDEQRRILAEVTRMVKTHRIPLRFLIVSRPEAHLCEAFEEPDLANIAQILSLYGDLKAMNDVAKYLRGEFSRIHSSKRHRDVMEFVPRPWLSKNVVDTLVTKSGGYFIYASTAIKFIDEEGFSPADRLDQVLNTSDSTAFSSDSAPFAELDKLYLQILSSYPTSKLPMFKRIVGYVVFPSVMGTSFMDTFGFLGVLDIEALLCLQRGKVKLMLRGLRSLVSFGGWENGTVTIYLNHASFGDFLHDKERSKDYHVDFEEWVHTAFYDALSLGCKVLGFSVDAGIQSASSHPNGLSVTVTCFL